MASSVVLKRRIPASRLRLRFGHAFGEVKFRHARAVVTPVETGVHPHPQNLDTVFQRYDGRCPSPGFRFRGNDDKEKVDFESLASKSRGLWPRVVQSERTCAMIHELVCL